MSRKHKKRNKTYTGQDAVPDQPVVHRYTAVVRSPFGEWWQDHKRTARVVSIIGGIFLAVGFLIYGIIDIIF
jgi:hypothetical protein